MSSLITTNRLGRAAYLAALLLLLWANTAAAAPPFAAGNCGKPVCTWLPFGPQTYTRNTSQAMTVTNTFSILNPNTQYTLHVQNSGVSSATISINGVQILGTIDFEEKPATIDKPVTLRLNNTIVVQILSKPTVSMAVSIIGVDNDLPVISALATPVADIFGWNNTNVAV